MKYTLKAKLSLAIAMVVLLTVTLISFLTNYLFEDQFGAYIKRQQEQRTQAIVSDLSQQYNAYTDIWNVESVHTIGMSALYDGYIIQVYDRRNHIIWDAQAHDMSLCAEIMQDISSRMENKFSEVNGDFTTMTLPVEKGGATVGSVSVLYYGPFFLNENDFQFLDNFNTVLGGIAVFSLILSVLVGMLVARRISRPILKTVDVAKAISDGDYRVRIEDKPDTREMHMLMHSVNHLAGSLQKQEALRKQLTADVAHELRTPIAIVQAQTEAMLDGVWAPTAERLQSCHDEISRMGKLVSDLESLAKTDAGNLKLDKTTFNLRELAGTVISRFEVELKKHRLNVAVRGQDLPIYADRDRISQVLINLMSNAIKYSDAGGEIEVSVLETPNSVVFSIQDNGIGIPEDELPFIFERFYRSDKSRNRTTGGSGIGLAIVKSIVEAHGGTVSVKSKLNEGSIFEVVLPKPEYL